MSSFLRFSLVAILLYVSLLLLTTQYLFFDNSLLTYCTRSIKAMISSMVCSPVLNEEYLATVNGRLDSIYPSPRCCSDKKCLNGSKKNIVLTTLRSDEYLPLLKNLVCSLKKSNPGVSVLVATVDGDLSQASMISLNALEVDIIFWDELRFQNKKSPRYELNWVKIRAWEMVKYDAILLLDTDTIVVDDITFLFDIPTAFATALDQDKTFLKYSSLGRMQGGVILLRPCAAVAKHMISLLESQEALRFTSGHAEQSFFDWYFRYERWTLPISYNSIAHLLQKDTLATIAGTKPIILHYTKHKPFSLNMKTHKEHAYAMCIDNG